MKEKEKYIQKLEHKCGNLTTNNKDVKTEMNKLKNENRKLLKNIPNKPLTKIQYSIDPNQNLQPAVSNQT